MLRKPDLYIKAISLRSKGFSYNEILKRVPVGHGTISRWCHAVPLTRKQKARLIKRRKNNPFIRAKRKQAFQSRKEAKNWAIDQTSKTFNEKELLLITGSMLYWAEGTKLSSHKSVEFTNTDPRMIMIMMKFFREILHIPESKFRIMVRIDNKSNLERAKRYWSRITGVPRRNFQRPEILKINKNRKGKIKYPYGICRISIHNVSMLRRITVLIEEFSKKFLKRI